MEQEILESQVRIVNSNKRKIDAVEFVRDIRAGLSDIEIMEKYHLSREELRNALEKIAKERDNIAKQLVKDIKAGVTELELMSKYKLTSRGLQMAYTRLVKLKYISRKEVQDKIPSFGTVITLADMRNAPRNFPAVEIVVYEEAQPDNLGHIIDVSEKGVGVKGIRAEMNDRKNLIIPSDEFGEFATVRFEGVCKWVDNGANGSRRSGFEILEISKGSLEELRFLIKAQTI